MPSSGSIIYPSLVSSTALTTAVLCCRGAKSPVMSRQFLPRRHKDSLRGLPQPALGPCGRHLSRFEPARIVLQGLGLLKLTEVTTRLNPCVRSPRKSCYLRYDLRYTLLGGTALPVSPSSQTFLCRLRSAARTSKPLLPPPATVVSLPRLGSLLWQFSPPICRESSSPVTPHLRLYSAISLRKCLGVAFPHFLRQRQKLMVSAGIRCANAFLQQLPRNTTTAGISWPGLKAEAVFRC